MDTDTLLTDDHVAELLAKEADDYSLRYSAMGLEAYRSSRPAAKAKPNTRFLRNIIRETKNHNGALLAKEAAEAQARLDSLAEEKAREERKHRPGALDLRRRQLGAITATLQGRNRRAGEGAEGSARRRDTAARAHAARPDRVTDRSARGSSATPANTDSDRQKRRDADGTGERRKRREDRSISPSSDDSRSRGSRQRHRSRSPADKERKHRHVHRHSRRYRNRSPWDSEAATDERSKKSRRKHGSDRHRDPESDVVRHTSSPRGEHGADRHRDPETDVAGRHTSSPRSHHRPRHQDGEQDDSDPLESLIGPIPPPTPQVRLRGRGAAAAASGPSAMDGRFSADYDPKSDLLRRRRQDSDLGDTEDGDDDWADSLEALRDRERWRRQGAERLRAAGFTDEQIKGWERSGGCGRGEKSVEDVRWVGKGEGREWDWGKDRAGVLGWDV